MRTRLLTSGWALLLFVLAGALAAPAAAEVRYSVIEIPDMSYGPYAINESGQAVGADTSRALLYGNGVCTDLGKLPGCTGSSAQTLNSAAQIAGVSAYGSYVRVFLWQDGVMTDLGIQLGGGSSVNGINDAGQVVGHYGPNRAFLWSNGAMTILSDPNIGPVPGVANAINNPGAVTGSYGPVGGGSHVFRWQGGILTDLGTLGGNAASGRAINDYGWITGESRVTGSALNHAFLFSGTMTDLGTLSSKDHWAKGINNRGEVVGWYNPAGGGAHAFLYSGGTIQDLNDMIEPNTGWVLESAYDINNRRWITGRGIRSGYRAVLLVPLRHALTVGEVNGNWGDVELSPEPNDVNHPEYPKDTVVTLTAVPIESKYFREWHVYDPNYPGDANYAVADSNNPLTIIMDADHQVDAVFACSSGVGPVFPLMLGLLGLFVVMRRKW